jgi:hypothetical protein
LEEYFSIKMLDAPLDANQSLVKHIFVAVIVAHGGNRLTQLF